MNTVLADPEQAEVIAVPASQRLLVSAGPGSGKTWTAAQRLATLARWVIEQREDPGRLLAITFSRTAAAAMTEQLFRAGVQPYVEVRTLDSWVTAQLITQRGLLQGPHAGEETSLESLNYERRIDAARRALMDGRLVLPPYAHVIIDEAQDVYGSRAELALGLLTAPSTIGWTVLGDRAQAIFEFGADGQQNLLDLVEAKAGQCTRRELLTCHRTSNPALLKVREAGKLVRVQDPVPSDLTQLQACCLSLSVLKEAAFASTAPKYIERCEHTAVLFRDNRSLLSMSSRLSKVGVEHRIATGRLDDVVPAWVSELNRSGRGTIIESDVAASVPDGLDADLILRSLRVVCRSARGRLAVPAIANAVATGFLPEPLLRDEPRGIVLSTVHRAKGLEFYRCLLTPGVWERATESAEEARILYVAMTRPTTVLAKLELAEEHPKARLDRMHGVRTRLIERSFRGNNVEAAELLPSDVTWLAPRHSLAERIERFESMTLGEGVSLELAADHDSPLWRVRRDSDGAEVARTVPTFTDVAAALGGKGRPLPTILKGGRVTGFRTIALPIGALTDGRQLVKAPIIRGMISPSR